MKTIGLASDHAGFELKQYVKQLYSKLHIEGDTRTKRSQLSELLAGKN